jgi:hypothetical protein
MDSGPLAADERAGHVCVATITNSGSSLVHVLDARSGRLLSTTPVGLAGSYPVRLVADARTGRVVMATGNVVCVLDGHSGALLRTVAVGSAFGAVAVEAQAGRAYVVGQVNAGGSTATLPGNVGSGILYGWSAQMRRWLPWLPWQPPPIAVPSGASLLSVLDAAR